MPDIADCGTQVVSTTGGVRLVSVPRGEMKVQDRSKCCIWLVILTLGMMVVALLIIKDKELASITHRSPVNLLNPKNGVNYLSLRFFNFIISKGLNASH